VCRNRKEEDFVSAGSLKRSHLKRNLTHHKLLFIASGCLTAGKKMQHYSFKSEAGLAQEGILCLCFTVQILHTLEYLTLHVMQL
jgi:hypothetical protein